mmetsp:Transcript_73389/g.212404  ORF Transcript_73389/g.212404 Transcript_73389/m.212404 type:complete len:268 (-) Transcript_73389:247-1050(-)
MSCTARSRIVPSRIASTMAPKTKAPKNKARWRFNRHHWIRARSSKMRYCTTALGVSRLKAAWGSSGTVETFCRRREDSLLSAGLMFDSMLDSGPSSSMLKAFVSCTGFMWCPSASAAAWRAKSPLRLYMKSRNWSLVTRMAPRPAMRSMRSVTTSSLALTLEHFWRSILSSMASTVPLLFTSMDCHSSLKRPARSARSSASSNSRPKSSHKVWPLATTSLSCSRHIPTSIAGLKCGSLTFRTSPAITSMNQSAAFSFGGHSNPQASK